MRTRIALALLVLLSLAGCSGLQAADSGVPSAAEAREGYAALDSLTGTITYGAASSSTAANATARVWSRPKSGMMRQRLVAPARMAGDVTVTNGTVSWIYDASANTVTRVHVGGENVSRTSDREFVARVFGNVSGSGNGYVVANPPLPVGPVGGGESASRTTLDVGGETRMAVTYLGTRRVAGRQTHGVRLTPVGAGNDTLARYLENVTYWFDAEYFYPLRVRTATAIGGNVSTVTQRYLNVTFDAGVPVERFRFDPPPNATVRSPTPTERTTYDSVAAADANVSFDAPDPDVPAALRLESATVRRGLNRTAVALRYANRSAELVVTTRRSTADPGAENGSVDLGPVNATATSLGDARALVWQCGGRGHVVRGNVSAGVLRSVARDVAARCP